MYKTLLSTKYLTNGNTMRNGRVSLIQVTESFYLQFVFSREFKIQLVCFVDAKFKRAHYTVILRPKNLANMLLFFIIIPINFKRLQESLN